MVLAQLADGTAKLWTFSDLPERRAKPSSMEQGGAEPAERTAGTGCAAAGEGRTGPSLRRCHRV